MSDEIDFITALRAIARHPAARGLADDAAVLPIQAGRDLVLTHDMLVEGIHYLPDDPPGDVAWKLVAVNLSDLAAKGARPIGVLTGFTLGDDPAWRTAFAAGLGVACAHFDVPLLGGDTVASPGPRVLGLTAIGSVAEGQAPARNGARAGESLWVTGTIGDAGAGLAIAQGATGPETLRTRYRRPLPRLAAGTALAPHVSAMMDISDGLLIDAGRLAAASGVAIAIRLDAVPLSAALARLDGQDRTARLRAVTAGDDYELLFSAPNTAEPALRAAARASDTPIHRIGTVRAGSGLTLADDAGPVPLPMRLGYLHGDRPTG